MPYTTASGTVKVGTYDIAEITGYRYNKNANLIRDDNAFDDNETYQVGKLSGAGSIQCHYDPTDTNAQNTLRAGASVVLHIRPGGTGAGKKDWTGTVIIESFGITGEKDGLVECEVGFKGILTESAA